MSASRTRDAPRRTAKREDPWVRRSVESEDALRTRRRALEEELGAVRDSIRQSRTLVQSKLEDARAALPGRVRAASAAGPRPATATSSPTPDGGLSVAGDGYTATAIGFRPRSEVRLDDAERRLLQVARMRAAPAAAGAAPTDGEGRLRSQLLAEFDRLDTNGSGFLSRSELRDALYRVGLDASVAEIDRLVRRFDEDRDGLVSYREFVDHLDRLFHRTTAAGIPLPDLDGALRPRPFALSLAPVPTLKLGAVSRDEADEGARSAPSLPPSAHASARKPTPRELAAALASGPAVVAVPPLSLPAKTTPASSTTGSARAPSSSRAEPPRLTAPSLTVPAPASAPSLNDLVAALDMLALDALDREEDPLKASAGSAASARPASLALGSAAAARLAALEAERVGEAKDAVPRELLASRGHLGLVHRVAPAPHTVALDQVRTAWSHLSDHFAAIRRDALRDTTSTMTAASTASAPALHALRQSWDGSLRPTTTPGATFQFAGVPEPCVVDRNPMDGADGGLALRGVLHGSGSAGDAHPAPVPAPAPAPAPAPVPAPAPAPAPVPAVPASSPRAPSTARLESPRSPRRPATGEGRGGLTSPARTARSPARRREAAGVLDPLSLLFDEIRRRFLWLRVGAEMERQFTSFDVDQDGTLSQEELRAAIAKRGLLLTDKEFRALLRSIRADEPGADEPGARVSYERFMRWLSLPLRRAQSPGGLHFHTPSSYVKEVVGFRAPSSGVAGSRAGSPRRAGSPGWDRTTDSGFPVFTTTTGAAGAAGAAGTLGRSLSGPGAFGEVDSHARRTVDRVRRELRTTLAVEWDLFLAPSPAFTPATRGHVTRRPAPRRATILERAPNAERGLRDLLCTVLAEATDLTMAAEGRIGGEHPSSGTSLSGVGAGGGAEGSGSSSSSSSFSSSSTATIRPLALRRALLELGVATTEPDMDAFRELFGVGLHPTRAPSSAADDAGTRAVADATGFAAPSSLAPASTAVSAMSSSASSASSASSVSSDAIDVAAFVSFVFEGGLHLDEWRRGGTSLGSVAAPLSPSASASASTTAKASMRTASLDRVAREKETALQRAVDELERKLQAEVRARGTRRIVGPRGAAIAEVVDLRPAFRFLDRRARGSITASDLALTVSELGWIESADAREARLRSSASTASSSMAARSLDDPEAESALRYHEFVRWALPLDLKLETIQSKVQVLFRRQATVGGGGSDFERAFRRIDRNGDGFLSMGEFKSALGALARDLSDTEIALLADHFDVDGSGRVDYREFVGAFRPLFDHEGEAAGFPTEESAARTDRAAGRSTDLPRFATGRPMEGFAASHQPLRGTSLAAAGRLGH